MPFSEVKIDRLFVMAASTSERHRLMIVHTVEVARLLGLKTVAEGVETRTERDLLASLGCDMIQGFFVAEPMGGEEFLRWMVARRANVEPNLSKQLGTERLFGT